MGCKCLNVRITGLVEVLHAYSNPSSQVDAALRPIGTDFKQPDGRSSLSRQSHDGSVVAFSDALAVPPRALRRRLTDQQRQAIVEAFHDGVPQQVLADRYGISVRSVKRLVRAARERAR
ncbi:sigma factor-like helix-turn-helix DNA-binding protein [Glycomyces halotolerans]